MSIPVLLQWRRPVRIRWQGADVVRISTADDQALTLRPVGPELVTMLRRLASPCTRHQLASSAPQLETGSLNTLLRDLLHSGLLGLAREPVRPPVVTVLGSSALAEATVAELRASGQEVCRLEGPDDGPCLVVADGQEVDRMVTDRLVRRRRHHLVLRVDDLHAAVGPFVRPGESPCLHCLDLARVQQDPRWPHLVVSAWHSPPAEDPLLLRWAALTAAAQVIGELRGFSVDTMGRTLELHLDGLCLRSTPVRFHPDCPCRSTGDTGERLNRTEVGRWP